MEARKMGLVFMVLAIMMMMMMGMDGVMGFKEFSVGGHHGWHVPDANDTDAYNHWAAKKRFHVGDTLLFKYKNDSVLVVDKYGYYHCDPSKAISTYNDGNTVIKLEHPGLIYFISGSADHCRVGQRVVIVVMSHHSGPVAAPSESHQDVEAPAPGKDRDSSSAFIAQVSAFLGLLVAASVLLV